MRVFSRQYASKIWSTGLSIQRWRATPAGLKLHFYPLLMEHFAEMDV
jgi:hypothetical protein